ncbi:MAG TPA: hypothetical protein VK536_01635 [Candidatus Limnocylindrales bacterium]|nr:hypothetical protein [Candidatus Limnocylindrales bacterium]
MSTTLQTGLSLTPLSSETRNFPSQHRTAHKPEQTVSAGTAVAGTVLAGTDLAGTVLAGTVVERLDNLYEPACAALIILPRIGFSLQEEETARQHNALFVSFISGFVNPLIATAKSDKKFTVDHLDYDNQTLAFVKPIVANISFDNDIFTCQNEELGIISASPNLDDCTKDFKDELLFIYKEYGKEEDNKLTEGAKELKRKILVYVGK